MLIFHTIPRWMPSRGLWPWGNTVGPPRSPRRKSTTRWSSSTPKRSHIWRICTPKWVENSKNILSILLITMLFHSSHLQVPSPNEISFTTGTCQGEHWHLSRRSHQRPQRQGKQKWKQKKEGTGVHNQEKRRTQLAKKMLIFKQYIFCPCLARNMLTVNCSCL